MKAGLGVVARAITEMTPIPNYWMQATVAILCTNAGRRGLNHLDAIIQVPLERVVPEFPFRFVREYG
jgi:hypothetical protein